MATSNLAFVVKNGFVVNNNLIYANAGSVGINTAMADATFAVVGTANVSGNAAIGGTFRVTLGATLSNTIAVTGAATFSNTIAVTGTSTLTGAASFGNTISVTNSATFSNTVSIAGLTTANNINGATINASANVNASNTITAGGGVFVANSSTVNSLSYQVGTIGTSSGFYVNSTILTIGNNSVNASINSTIFTGTSNNALYLGGTPAASFINTTGTYTISGSYTYSSNAYYQAAIYANGTPGSPGQVLYSNGTGAYWSTIVTSFGTAVTMSTFDNQFTGNGSNTQFTLSQSTTTNNAIVSINGIQQIPTVAYSISGVTLTFTEAVASGSIIDVRIPYIASQSGALANYALFEYTATAGQTTFTGNDNNGKSLSYAVNNIAVFKNGLKLQSTAYTATNGTSVVLGSGASASDVIVIESYGSITNTNDQTVNNIYLIANTSLITGNNAVSPASTSQVTIDSFPLATWRSVSYVVQSTTASNFQIQNINLVHNGSAVTMSEFGLTTGNGSIVSSFDASISGGNVLLQATPATATVTTFRVNKTMFAV